jgi:DinB superfamily
MKKEKVLEKLEAAWLELMVSWQGLTPEQMLTPGVTEDWSVRDILAHVSWWEEEALKHLPHILQGGRPQRYSVLYGGIDAFNAQMTERKYGLSLDQVLKELVETHRRLGRYLEDIPDEQFQTETRFRRRLKLDTYSHYPIHSGAIREWRKKLGLQ